MLEVTISAKKYAALLELALLACEMCETGRVTGSDVTYCKAQAAIVDEEGGITCTTK